MHKNFISRFVGFFCVAAIATSLVACGGDSGSGADEQEPQQSSDASAIEESSSSVGKTTDAKSSANDEEESSSSVAKEDSSSSGKDEEVEDEEAIPTSLEGVNGYMQKGPFVSGSKVRVLELESGRTLNQTGLNFETKIQTDDGKFRLNARTMVSQYVELHAEGYYRNEVTGTESEAPITLYAITDVSKRDGGLVNINLLTHLEYQRVVYLVKEKKMKFYEAKDQAQQEVLALLDITESEEFGSSEDLNIVGTTEADGALLAFSVMLQGDRPVAKLTSLLQSIVNDLEENGTWDDAAVKTEIADWAEGADHEGKLEEIRTNVANWKLGPVPNFEKYVRHFWYTNYDLGGCSTENNGEILKNGNRKSEKKTMYFVCDNNAWREMTDVEKDTYDYANESRWAAGFTGEVRKSTVSDNYYAYDGEKWRPASKQESDTYDYKNNRPWEAGSTGEMKEGVLTGTIYVFDESWREATDHELQWGFCDAAKEGVRPTDDKNYICRNGSWIDDPMHGSLWNMEIPAYQVQTPEVIACTAGDPFGMDDHGEACFQKTAGWWFAFDATPNFEGASASFSPANQNDDGTWELITTDGKGGPIIPGGNLVVGEGLNVTISVKGVDFYSPGIAGIGFYWINPQPNVSTRIKDHEGLCLTYSLSGNNAVLMELDWNRSAYGDDTWYVELNNETKKTINIPWDSFTQDGWDASHNTTVDDATGYSTGLRFMVRNVYATTHTVNFTIHALGWLGECGRTN